MELTMEQLMILMAVCVIIVILIIYFTNTINPLLAILAVAAVILIILNAVFMRKRIVLYSLVRRQTVMLPPGAY